MGAAGRTILLTGPPGAGKTRTSLLWSATRPNVFALDWDLVRADVVAVDALRDAPQLPIDEQYALAARMIAAHAAQITASGVDCVVVGARPPHPPPAFAGTGAALDELDPVTIVLLPSVDVCAARNAGDVSRTGDFAVAEARVHESYGSWGWERWAELPRAAVLDTSAMTLAEVVDACERAVEELI